MHEKDFSPEAIAAQIPYGFAKQYGVVAIPGGKDSITILHRPGLSSQTLLEIRRHLAHPFGLHEVSQDTFQNQLAKAYETDSDTAMQMAVDMEGNTDLAKLMQEMPRAEDLLESEDDAPIIRLLNAMFTEALKRHASDIHVESFEDRLTVRYRVDGVLHEVLSPPRMLAPMLISRIKVMAKLDIAEKRLPQDGRISLHVAGRSVDMRVSTMPTSHGERIVMRILDKQQAKLDLTSLGMPQNALDNMDYLIHQPNGIILVTGPTGSGKTTSLYAALSKLNTEDRNILTVEDPIEYDISGIGQTQVNMKADMTFARSLRAMLRQDPDIVMIGEIRDLETAETAVQASLTGHLVLSTLHTNTAVGAITRLIDMGVEPFLISSSLIGVVAQRLVRVLCPECKEAITPTEAQCQIMAVDAHKPPAIYINKGCDACSGTGFTGRTGIYEVIPLNDEMRTMIHDEVSEQALAEAAHRKYESIQQDGVRRVLAGETSLDEVLRVATIERQTDN
tara:strand:+ start:67793 stop:69307 length:1515 start_codon:yes stop_codon:yes gene_type:complete